MTWVSGQKVRASQMPGYVCTSGTRPAGHTGQTVYESDTGLFAFYTGSAWRYLVPGEGVIRGEYTVSGTQSVANTTDTVVAFGSDINSSPWVDKATSGAGHRFRLGLPGRWLVVATLRWLNRTNTGERYTAIVCNSSVIHSQSGGFTTSVPSISQNVSAPVHISDGASGTSAADVVIRAFQSTGGSHDVGEANTGTKLCLFWLGP